LAIGAPTEVARSPVGLGAGQLDVLRVVDAVAAHQRHCETGRLHLLRQRPGLRVLAAVVDRLRRGGGFTLADRRRVLVIVGVDRLGRDDGAAGGLNSLAKASTRPWP
jgi:hypothetical protein